MDDDPSSRTHPRKRTRLDDSSPFHLAHSPDPPLLAKTSRLRDLRDPAPPHPDALLLNSSAAAPLPASASVPAPPSASVAVAAAAAAAAAAVATGPHPPQAAHPPPALQPLHPPISNFIAMSQPSASRPPSNNNGNALNKHTNNTHTNPLAHSLPSDPQQHTAGGIYSIALPLPNPGRAHRFCQACDHINHVRRKLCTNCGAPKPSAVRNAVGVRSVSEGEAAHDRRPSPHGEMSSPATMPSSATASLSSPTMPISMPMSMSQPISMSSGISDVLSYSRPGSSMNTSNSTSQPSHHHHQYSQPLSMRRPGDDIPLPPSFIRSATTASDGFTSIPSHSLSHSAHSMPLSSHLNHQPRRSSQSVLADPLVNPSQLASHNMSTSSSLMYSHVNSHGKTYNFSASGSTTSDRVNTHNQDQYAPPTVQNNMQSTSFGHVFPTNSNDNSHHPRRQEQSGDQADRAGLYQNHDENSTNASGNPLGITLGGRSSLVGGSGSIGNSVRQSGTSALRYDSLQSQHTQHTQQPPSPPSQQQQTQQAQQHQQPHHQQSHHAQPHHQHPQHHHQHHQHDAHQQHGGPQQNQHHHQANHHHQQQQHDHHQQENQQSQHQSSHQQTQQEHHQPQHHQQHHQQHAHSSTHQHQQRQGGGTSSNYADGPLLDASEAHQMFVTATGQSLFSNVGNTLRTGGSSSGLAGAHSIANPSGLSSIGNGRSGAGLGVSVGLKHVSVVNNGNAVDGDGGASGGLGVGGLGVGRGSGGGDGGGRREDIGGADSGANVGRLDADKSILEGGNVNTQQSDEGRFAIGSILMPEKNAAREQQ